MPSPFKHYRKNQKNTIISTEYFVIICICKTKCFQIHDMKNPSSKALLLPNQYTMHNITYQFLLHYYIAELSSLSEY